MELNEEINPLIVADEIVFFTVDGLRDKTISLYSGFLLNQEQLRIRRMAYYQPAWSYKLCIRDIVALYMQYLFALAASEARVAATVAGWLREDLPLLAQRHDHYLAIHLVPNASMEPSRQLLTELSRVRLQYEQLSDDDGPFHTDVFPYDFFAPENTLLGHSDSQSFEKGVLEPKVEELLLSIGTGKWG